MVLAVVHHLEIAVARLVQLDYAQEFSSTNVEKTTEGFLFCRMRRKSQEQLTEEGEVVRVDRDQRSSHHCDT